jgi:uronate dehydrogenase
MEAAAAGEEVMRVALQEAGPVHSLLADVDAVVHLGGISTDGPFEPILQSNIVGSYHLYEAAREHGVRRIVFASSIT